MLTLFDPAFDSHGVPNRVKKCGFCKNICFNQISDIRLCIYINFQLLVIIKLETANFDPLLNRGGLENGVHKRNRSGFTDILKNNPFAIEKHSETNLSKVIQNILVLDLSIIYGK